MSYNLSAPPETGLLRILLVFGRLLSFAFGFFVVPLRADVHPASVILITIDTLRADHLGCYGSQTIPTPTANQLAQDGVVFERALAQVPLTLPSHTAILTGTYPSWNGVRDLTTTGLGPDIPTLAEVFKNHGYTTAAFVSSIVLNSMWGLNRGFELYDDAINPQEGKPRERGVATRRASLTIDHAIRWLEGRRSGAFFMWVHLYDPHAPYDPPEPFKTRFQARPYDGEVAYADQQSGRLISSLKAKGLYDSTLILLTSDHGEGLGEHGEQQHGLFIYNSTIHVPLILKPPTSLHFSTQSVNQVVNTVDIAPTLAQACGFPSRDSASFQGRILLPLLVSKPKGAPRMGYSESLYPRTSFGWHSLFGNETEKYHFIEAPRPELYDLTLDPGETHNIWGEKAAFGATLREDLRAWAARYARKDKRPQVAAIDLEKLRELRSLGYIGGSTAQPVEGDATDAPDPKDRVEIYTRIIRATELADDGRYGDSNALLEAASKEDPKAYLPPFLLAENALAQHQFSAALDLYRRALELNPRYDLAAIGMGQAALGKGDAAGAVRAFEWAAELNPNNYLVKLAMADAYVQLNRLSDALNLQKDVLAQHPEDGKANSDYGVALVRAKQYREGLAALEKAVGVGYRTAVTLNFLGTALLATGKNTEAVNAYKEATHLDPKYAAPFGNLALLSQREGHHEQARRYYQQVCQIDAKLCQELGPRFH